MLSKTEREYLTYRLEKGKDATRKKGKLTIPTIRLKDKKYDKNYQKVLNHRIKKKFDMLLEDISTIAPHQDIWKTESDWTLDFRNGPFDIIKRKIENKTRK